MEYGVMIDDNAGLSWWSLNITNDSQYWSETTFVSITCLQEVPGVKKGGSWSMSTLESSW